jgi:hypothetical protein
MPPPPHRQRVCLLQCLLRFWLRNVVVQGFPKVLISIVDMTIPNTHVIDLYTEWHRSLSLKPAYCNRLCSECQSFRRRNRLETGLRETRTEDKG